MAKYVPSTNMGKQEKYPFPSRFGSHASMIDSSFSEFVTDPNFVVCKDTEGLYITEKKRLDSGMSDPFRYASEEYRNNYLAKFGIKDTALQEQTK